jgi:hypothetical protein
LSQLWPPPQVPLPPPLRRLVLLLALPPAQRVPVRPRVLAAVGLPVDPAVLVVVLAVAQEPLLHQ